MSDDGVDVVAPDDSGGSSVYITQRCPDNPQFAASAIAAISAAIVGDRAPNPDLTVGLVASVEHRKILTRDESNRQHVLDQASPTVRRQCSRRRHEVRARRAW